MGTPIHTTGSGPLSADPRTDTATRPIPVFALNSAANSVVLPSRRWPAASSHHRDTPGWRELPRVGMCARATGPDSATRPVACGPRRAFRFHLCHASPPLGTVGIVPSPSRVSTIMLLNALIAHGRAVDIRSPMATVCCGDRDTVLVTVTHTGIPRGYGRSTQHLVRHRKYSRAVRHDRGDQSGRSPTFHRNRQTN